MNDLFASAPRGLEGLLSDELRALGAVDVKETRAGCSFRGELETAYRVCLWSRLAARVFLSLGSFPAADPDQLYEGALDVDWAEHLRPEGTLAVSAAVRGASSVNTHYLALRVKDAIVGQFRERSGVRPSVDVRRPDVRVDVLLDRGQATLAIDLSGESLHRRGYRREGEQVEAPLKENLAAAVLLRSGWPEIAACGGALLDPVCGSGTLLIEAALISGDAAPGLLRSYFGFLGWLKHDPDLWGRLIAEAQQRRRAGMKGVRPVVGYDSDPRAVALARGNAGRAGLAEVVRVERFGLERLAPPWPAGSLPAGCPGLVVANPPYGERLGTVESVRGLYVGLGEGLRNGFPGWKFGLLTAEAELAWATGLRAQRSYSLYNGALPVKLYLFLIGEERGRREREGHAPPREARSAAKPPPSTPAPPGPAGDARARGAGAGMFADRLRKDLRHFRRWARRQEVSCYRVYDADLPEYNLAVDIYEEWVHVQEYEAPATIEPERAAHHLAEALEVIPEVLGVPGDHVFLKVRRRQRGAAQYERQDSTGRYHEVSEAGCRFLVNLTDYLDTGLFLDHRITRALLAEWAVGKRFLNLFGYTGTATVRAAAAGAAATTTVDLSPTYLDWARRNMELNGFSPGAAHSLVQADVMAWLEEEAANSHDVVFLDPPTFSNSKRAPGSVLDIQRDHVALIRTAMRTLAPEGTLLFSTNFRRFRLDQESLADLSVTDITRRTIPPDFARNPKIHACWLIRRPLAERPFGTLSS